MPTQIFVNLPVKDLNRSMGFFKTIGFTFNPQFTNEQGACMVVSDTIYVMLLTEPFFQSFTNKAIPDAAQAIGSFICLSAGSRQEVDETIAKAVAAGATTLQDPTDYGWMYGHEFIDLDGHAWEFAYMDVAAMPQQ